jgi:hypothetical protein
MTLDGIARSKGLDGLPDSAMVYEDGFVYLQPIDIGGVDADNLIVGRANDRYSIALLKGVMKTIKQRKRLLISFIDGNHDEMIAATIRTGGEVLPDNFCIWRK